MKTAVFRFSLAWIANVSYLSYHRAEMLTAVRGVLSKLVYPLWRTVEVDGEATFDGTPGICTISKYTRTTFTQLNRDVLPGVYNDSTNTQIFGFHSTYLC